MNLWYEWYRMWHARRNGTIDGKSMIPDRGDPSPAQYSLYLRDRGQELVDRLDLRFKKRDRRMHPSYREYAILYGQARDAHLQAQQEAALARQEHQERPTERRKLRLRQAALRAAELHRLANRAERRLESVIAYRLANYSELRARCLLLKRQTEKYMKHYTLANVRSRDDGNTPPGLAEEAQPRITLPDSLGGLEWDPPLDEARAGRARGQFGPRLEP